MNRRKFMNISEMTPRMIRDEDERKSKRKGAEMAAHESRLAQWEKQRWNSKFNKSKAGKFR